MVGEIYQINVKPLTEGERGIPKMAVSKVYVSSDGLEGDHNQHRQEKLEGDLDQAILLMTGDVISDLWNEGWPVSEGDLGENVNIRGVDYNFFAPGERYRLGEEVIVRITRACDPCINLSVLSYVGESYKKSFIRTLLGRRGWYARVEEPGEIKLGDVLKV